MNNQISQLKRQFSRNAINVFGKPIAEKIVVIESDDWGTIRMSSKEAFNELKTKVIILIKVHTINLLHSNLKKI